MTDPETDPARTPPAQPHTFTFTRTFTFGGAPSADADVERKPMTYYEALSGRPDPHRDFFVNARRMLNLSVTVLAIALPLGLMALAFFTGADLQTIVFAGIGGAIVGLMFKSTFPKTPFD